ncbi:hypothetical protein ACIBH1_22135 [Nonomuraea sp. NPDC050663]|uniref:hypothetical protein n=1 Tax=Nonomuraea sp. NPDC050663 TaxID=3364370 RepID=UPI0037ADF231
MKRSLARTAAILVAAAGLTSIAPSSAAAASALCSGYSCDGTYASRTGCYAGSYTPTKSGTAVVRTSRGTLRMFYGPACKTNWARFTPSRPGGYRVTIVREPVDDYEETGYVEERTVSEEAIPALRIRTPQVYAPVAEALACVEHQTVKGNWVRLGCTDWI